MAINITTNENGARVTQVLENHATALETNKPAAQEPKEAQNATPEVVEETSTESANVANDETVNEFDYLNGDDTEETEEEDESDDEEDEDDTEEDEVVDQPKKSGFKKRVDKLTKAITESKSENAQLKAKLLQLEAMIANNGNAQPNKTEQAPVTVDTSDLVKPKLDDFEDYSDYLEALTDYKVEVKERAKLAEYQKIQIDKLDQERKTAWDAKTTEARKKYKDFDNIYTSDVPATEFMRSEIYNSDIGAEIAYHLYKNPKEATRIAGLIPQSQIKEMGKLEAKLEMELTKRSKSNSPANNKATKAPEPVKPISNSSTKGSTKKHPDDMTYQEYKAWVESEKLKKNKK